MTVHTYEPYGTCGYPKRCCCPCNRCCSERTTREYADVLNETLKIAHKRISELEAKLAAVKKAIE